MLQVIGLGEKPFHLGATPLGIFTHKVEEVRVAHWHGIEIKSSHRDCFRILLGAEERRINTRRNEHHSRRFCSNQGLGGTGGNCQ
jgi:hypothetical protein